MPADANAMRKLFNLPAQTPEELLTVHLSMALEKLKDETGLAQAPADKAAKWDEAVMYWAVSTAVPWLHTFYMSGVAPALRLSEGIELRFLTPQEQSSLRKLAENEYGIRRDQLIGVSPVVKGLPFSLGSV